MAKDFNSCGSESASLTATALKTKLERLRAELARLEALIAERQTEFRETSADDKNKLAALLRMTADLMSTREASAQIQAQLTALRAARAQRPWWWRMLAG